MLNELNKNLLGAPDLKQNLCAVCGAPAQNNHHVIQKGMGGTKHKDIPVISLCGMGNTSGCHGLAHSGRLHFDYRDGWYFLLSNSPISRLTALEREEWRRCNEAS